MDEQTREELARHLSHALDDTSHEFWETCSIDYKNEFLDTADAAYDFFVEGGYINADTPKHS